MLRHQVFALVLGLAVFNGIFSPLVVANLPYGVIPDATYNNFSPAVTVAWEANPNVNFYARFAQGSQDTHGDLACLASDRHAGVPPPHGR